MNSFYARQYLTNTSLDEHAQDWLHLILCAALQFILKKLGGKQRGKPTNVERVEITIIMGYTLITW